MGVLRVLLALSVVLSHLGDYGGISLAGGFASVQMFYIISGFYMATILTEKYDPRRDLGVFYTNRFLRIYSIYFVALAMSLAGYYALWATSHSSWFYQAAADNVPNLNWPTRLWLSFTGLFVFGQETTLFQRFADGGLIFTSAEPDNNNPVWHLMPVPQAWSISIELVFYCLVPFLIRLRTRWLVAIIVVTEALRVWLYYGLNLDHDPWLSRFFPLEIATFVMGMVARRIYDRYIYQIPRRTQITIGAGFIIGACFIRALMFTFPINQVVWPFYICALIALPCLFQLTRNSKLDSFIGNFSYPLYLIHWFVLIAYDALTAGWHLPSMNTGARVAICLALSFFLSWIIMILVEVPLDRYRQRRYARMSIAAKG